MKHWRVHFCWAIVTALAVVVSARVAAPPESSTPPHVCPKVPVATASAREEAPRVEEPAAPPVPVSVPTTETAAAGTPLVERLRAMFKRQDAWQELQTLTADVAGRGALIEALKQILGEEDYQGRFYAISALQMLRGREAAKILEDYIAGHWAKDDGITSTAVNAVGEIGDTTSVPVLNEALRSRSEDVRLSSAQALLRLGYGGPAGDVIAAMTRQFESPDGGLRKKAIENLVRMSPEASVGILVRGLRDTNGDVRLQALWGISGLGKPEYAALVRPLENDPHPDVAEAAKSILESLTEK